MARMKLSKLGFVLVMIVTGLLACGQSKAVREDGARLQFFGQDNKKFVLSFDTYLLFQIPDDWQGPVDQLLESEHREEIDAQIDLQLAHMFGVFTTHDDFVNNPGVVANSPDVTILGVEKVPGEPYAKISYSYEDEAVFHKGVVKKFGHEISFWLPKDVVGIYAKGIPAGHRLNYCTDHHYNSEGDFWYFWNPRQEGCPIERKDLVRVKARIKPLPSTKRTYPDYHKLYNSNGNRKTLKVSALIGIDESFDSGDLGRLSYTRLSQSLRDHGYVATEHDAWHTVFTRENADFNLELTLYLLDPQGSRFDEIAIDGLETADIFLYSGHSGLGGHLAPGRFEDFIGRRLKLPKDKYQIFIFQGCSTFAYYNEDYFGLKASSSDPTGTKNLDIVTTGIGLSFDSSPNQEMKLLNALLDGSKPSWQKIISDIYAADPESTALHQVNGDEDNATTPE